MTVQLGRFILRNFSPWDGPALFALTGNPQVTKYMGFRTHSSVDEAEAMLMRYQYSPTKWQAICPVGEQNDVAGVLGFEVKGHQASLTIMMRNDWRTRGAGREIMTPFVQWAFTHPQLWRLWWFCHVDNIMAQHGLERLGALREGRLRRFEYFPNVSGEPQDCFVYSVVKT